VAGFAKRREFAGHPPQFIARHEELARRCITQVRAKREPPDEHVLIEHPEGVAKRAAAQVELMAQQAGRPGGLPGARGPRRRERAATRPGQRRVHVRGQLDVFG